MEGLRGAATTPYALLLATYSERDAAEEAARELASTPWQAETMVWVWEGEERFDLYVTGFADLPQAAASSLRLRELGWDPELVVVPFGGR
jgi:hypothetical protein